MPITPQDYNNDATKGSQLQRLMANEIRDRIKGDIPDVIARALVDLARRMDSLESEDQNLGDVYADSVDAQTLKVGGINVKTRQAAKSNPSASSGSATTFVDTISQNENGELTATRRAMKLYTGTGTNTDAPMTQKAVKDALDTKAPIASPTFTGTPAAPTASGSTDTMQIATTAFVHDAIENDLKKAADVSGMGNDDTHAYSGEAVSMAISSAVSGNVGGFLGNMTVAQMNAYTNPKMGDNAIVTDTGTITVGSEQCVILTAPSEVRWTTSGSWKISSAGYVRVTQVATNSVLGLVKTNSVSGGVNLNGSNQMVVVGWNDKQDALPICEGTGLFDIDIAGSASSIRNGTPTYYSTDALFIPIQESAPTGNTWSTIFDSAIERLANKGRVFAYYGGEVVQNTVYEKYLQAAYIYKPRGSSIPTEIHFNEVLDDLHDYGQNINHGLLREYTFKSTGWESISGTVHWPYYAENAVNATNASYASADSNGVSLIVAKNSSGKITSIGAAGIAAETASTAGYATSAYRATYADEATDAINASYAVNDSNGNNIITTYGHKQLYVRLPDIALVALPTGYSSVNSWTPLFDPPSSASAEEKPEFHFYHLDLNFINVDFGGYDTVATELRICNYYKTSSSTQIWSLTQLAATAIIVPKGSSSHNLVIPFQNNTLYPLRLVLEVKFGNGVVSGNALGYQWYTSLAY